ncbi:protein of unknown function [Anaerovirgula multivorans]|uniref:DUF4179 domain-containing protein n=1 Tax=Anaerovirgula multivorans TaxID=312168 RepID=A0A239F7Q7_9FIRM|nr:DUF4179 domain-containing protein [Anaerovirgula multivorans]SNS52791.1 protein of unknown function [Anaerovirgula multivorans]
MNNNNETNQKKGEYRIDKMFSEIFEMETMNILDGSDLLQDDLSKEEKERILKMTIGKIGVENEDKYTTSHQPRGKKRKILTVALIAVFALVTTAFAAEIFQWDIRISNYFGIEEYNNADLSGGGMNVGISDENNGVTIEVVQTIGDANNLYILLDITAPEDKVIYSNIGFDAFYLQVEGATSHGYSFDMLDDDNENDNKATILVYMDADEKINNGKMISLKFRDLRHYINGDWITDIEGEWNLEWKLDYEDISTKYTIGKKLMVDGETVNIDSISISPIALNVQISGSYIEEHDSKPPETGTGELIQITAIELKDGTVLTQKDASMWGSSMRGTKCVLNMQMKRLIDVDQIKSITLNDTKIVL